MVIFLLQNIPIVADDEANQDDGDDDDEFGNKSLAEKHSLLDNDDGTDSPIRVCQRLFVHTERTRKQHH